MTYAMIALMGLAGLLFGIFVGHLLVRRGAHARYGFPPITPPPAAEAPGQWWPLKVDELRPGAYYRCRLSKRTVMALCKGSQLSACQADGMICRVWNNLRCRYEEVVFRDGELETDDASLAPGYDRSAVDAWLREGSDTDDKPSSTA